MSDTNNIQFVENGLSKTLGTSIKRSSVSGYYDNYSNLTPEFRRHLAVTTALELIKADISGSHDNKTTSLLHAHLDSLGEYADFIQKALELAED